MLFQTSYIEASKHCSIIWQYLVVSDVSIVPKVLTIVSFKTGTVNFKSPLYSNGGTLAG